MITWNRNATTRHVITNTKKPNIDISPQRVVHALPEPERCTSHLTRDLREQVEVVVTFALDELGFCFVVLCALDQRGEVGLIDKHRGHGSGSFLVI